MLTDTLRDQFQASLADRYALERELGRGGMATVYLAEDLRHRRSVAIKVLHPELSAILGPERFLKEIELTANLQHPHILPLFDSGSAGGLLYYVMPYVDGETLRARLEREAQLPIDDATRIARDTADALQYAHERRVVHRDIKPENILLQNGHALVADFGIALAVQSAGGQRMTQTGLSLGTPQYMSPEQAMGEKMIDARTDVYALGAVLYEMLTGDPPFTGSTVQAIVAKVMSAEPEPVTLLRKNTPATVATAVHRALEKVPADRFATAADFATALHSGAGATTPTAKVASVALQLRSIAIGVAVGIVAVIALGALLRPRVETSVTRYALGLPESQGPLVGVSAPAIAPDGSFLVYLGAGGPDNRRLWIKHRDQYGATPIAATDGATNYALSPDGRWVAFTQSRPGSLHKVAVDGGEPTTVLSSGVTPATGITWLTADSIVFGLDDDRGFGVVSASGGAPGVLWKSDSLRAFSPAAAAGGRVLLFAVCGTKCMARDIAALEIRGRRVRAITTGTLGHPQWLPDGHVAYMLPDGHIVARAFDAGRLELNGPVIPVADSLGEGASAGDTPFRVSSSGMLATLADAGPTRLTYDLVWVDRNGHITPVDTSWRFHQTLTQGDAGLALSPDGSRVAIGLSTDASDNIWVKDLRRGPAQRITFDNDADFRPRWTANGRFVTYIREGQTLANVGFYARHADGTGSDSLLAHGSLDEAVVVPGGSWYLMRGGALGEQAGGRMVLGMRAGVDTGLVPMMPAHFDQEAVMPSRDGRWLAYQSDETGRTEIFVRPFPNVNDAKEQVSRNGGTSPLWSTDGRQLYFLGRDSTMMVVDVGAAKGSALPLTSPRALFRLPSELLGDQFTFAYYTPWDVAADGRFLMPRVVNAANASGPVIRVTEHWLEDWKRRNRF